MSSQSSKRRPRLVLRTLLMVGLFLSLAALLFVNLATTGEELSMTETATPWKYDVEVISSPQYVVNNSANTPLYCDKEDRLWARVWLSFAENTDAYHARATEVTLVSEDQGVTWQVTDHPWPGPVQNRSVLPDGTIVETASNGWVRYPRSEIKRLQDRGYYVWDLGEEAGYCAIIYDMWVRRSTDGGQTWEEFPVHQQFPFFAKLCVNSPPRQRLLNDGTIITFAYGYLPEGRTEESDLGGLCNTYILRSSDAGTTWQMIRMADGHLSPSPRGFGEIYPVVWRDGRIFALMRTAAGTPAYSVWSDDGGLTWSEPRPTPIAAKHPNPALLRDGTIVCTYQRRFAPPFGVRARFTSDLGKTWSDEVILRDDIAIADGLSQPQTVELSDGTLFTIFTAKKYVESGGVQFFVGGTRWARGYQPLPHIQEKLQQIRERGSWGPEFPLPPLTPRYNWQTAGTSPWQPAPEQP